MPQPPTTSIAVQLDRLTDDWDTLVRDARLREERLGRPVPGLTLHDLEDRAQRLASAIVAPFRGAGAKPVHPPLQTERRPDGSTRCGW